MAMNCSDVEMETKENIEEKVSIPSFKEEISVPQLPQPRAVSFPKKNKGQCILPPKDTERDYKAAGEITVATNQFRLEVDPNQMIFKFNIQITKKVPSKGIERNLTTGIKSDAARLERIKMCRLLFKQVVEEAASAGHPLFNDDYSVVYDGGNILYSCHVWHVPENALEDGFLVITLGKDDIKDPRLQNYLGAGRADYQVEVKITETICFEMNFDGDAKNVQEFIQCLDIVTSAPAVRRREHYIFNNKFFSIDDKEKQAEGKQLNMGVEKSVRLGEENGKAVPMLQLEAKKSPFISSSSVLSYAEKVLPHLSREKLQDIRGRDLDKLKEQLKNVVVKTRHMGDKNRTFHVSGIQIDVTPATASFSHNGVQTTMDQYFKIKYNYPLKYPKIPCIVEKKARENSYFPMEVLEIVSGQRVNADKSGNLKIDKCRMDPLTFKEKTEQALADIYLDKQHQILKNFGIRIKNRLMDCAGKLLFPPAIKYSNGRSCEPKGSELPWQLNGKQFIRPGKIRRMHFIIFDRCMAPHEAKNYISQLIRSGRDLGMELPNPDNVKVNQITSECDDELDEFFHKFTGQGDYAIAITRQKLDPIHDVLKLLEAKYEVVTQHIWLDTTRKGRASIENILQKMNLKAGGHNHDLYISEAFLRRNNDSEIAERIFSKDRMLIGLDMSHAGAQSFADRALHYDCEPSVIGMAYTLETYTETRGCFWFQRSRETYISKLTEKIMEALLARKKETGSLPDDIIVLRGGASEGEFQYVQDEMRDVRASFAQVQAGYNPSLTCLLIIANSQCRLFKDRLERRGKPVEQNVPSGTIVTSGVTNPNYNEFILVAQKGIIGTVRPMKCVIVVREKGTSGQILHAEDLQLLTHALCYGKQVFKGPTTLPNMVLHAADLAERGRNNWKTEKLSNEKGFGKRDSVPQDAEALDQLAAQFNSKLNCHYWA